METMVDTIHDATGRHGLLELMLSEDKHGYTPLDYVVPEQQPNWRKIVDTVVSRAAAPEGCSSCPPSSHAPPSACARIARPQCR